MYDAHPAFFAVPTPPCSAAPHQRARRGLLRAGAAIALLGPALAAAQHAARLAGPGFGNRPRSLWVSRPQAQESVRAVYWADGRLLPDGYAQLTRLYRDLIAAAEHPIAVGLLDLNFAMQAYLYGFVRPRPLILLSGYRTAATNARVGGVEPNIHGLGLADDFRYEGLSLLENVRLARAFQVGGLGIYPERGSLHKDLGRRRSWVTRGPAQPGSRGGAR